MKITIPFAGSVIVDYAANTLQASSHLVGQKLLVGYTADTTGDLDKGRDARRAVECQASADVDWQWLDHNGFGTSPQ